MAKKIFVVFLSLLVTSEMTESFPVFRYHTDQSERESGAEPSRLQDHTSSERSMQGKRDVSLTLERDQRLSKPALEHDIYSHGLSRLHLSRDESKTSDSKVSWFAANRKNPKFIAVSIFLGCLAFMFLAFVIAYCVHYKKQSERVKKATEVDVRSREDLSVQVSKIEDAHVDVGSY